MKKLNWLFLSFLVLAVAACDDDDDGDATLDTQAPTISITAPTEGAEFAPGDVVNISFNVEDDIGLETVTLSVTQPDGTSSEVDSWDVDDNLFTDGTDFDEEFELTLPATTAPGTYVIMVDAVDQAGNAATQARRTISVMDGSQQGENIAVSGIANDTTLNVLGGAEGTPVTFNFTGEEGVDSINVSATNEAGTEYFSQVFNEDYFAENNIDNTGDFTIEENLMFPNTSVARGAGTFTVRTFRGDEELDARTYNFNLEPAEGTREVTFNTTPPADLPEGSRVFTSGNFLGDDMQTGIDDPGYELVEDPNTPGTYTTVLYATPDRNFNYRYSMMDPEGNSAYEVDEGCVEAGPDFRSYNFAEGTEAVDEGDINFPGFGGC